MSMTHSVVLIAPAEIKDRSDKIACAFALGYDPLPRDSFVRPLSADGRDPATHYGCHVWADTDFVAKLDAAGKGAPPPVDWGKFAMSEKDAADTAAALIVSVREIGAGSARQHWNEVLAAQSLQTIQAVAVK
jgi:hypothetical protein